MATHALAQNALDAPTHSGTAPGQGNALDANLSTRGRSNERGSQPDYRLRNLVVTGDVADGRGFRGSVGYRAADDFRGTLGTDTLRDFRSYSASSDPLLFQSMSSSSRFDTAQGLGVLEYRRAYGQGPSGAFAEDGRTYGVRATDSVLAVSVRAAIEDRVARDSSTSILQLDGRPRTLRELPNASLILSPVAGWQAVDPRYATYGEHLSPYDVSRLRYMERTLSTRDLVQPFNSRLRTKIQLPGEALDASDRSTQLAPEPYWRANDAIEAKLKQKGEQSVPDAIARIRKRLGDADLWADDIADSRLDVLRDKESRERAAVRRAAARIGEGTGTSTNDGATDTASGAPGGAAEGGEAEVPWDPIEAANLLRHNEVLRTLVPTGEGRATVLLSAAQGAMEDGRYLDAAELFESASMLSPANPLAKAGRAMSLVAGGLPASGGLKLRLLFSSHPEMISMRLDSSLSPPAQRLRDVAALSLSLARESAGIQRADMGLAAAYCGWQLADPTIVRDGLDVLASDPGAIELVAVLRAIWLDPPPGQ